MASFDIAILSTADQFLRGDDQSTTATLVDMLTRHGYQPRCSLAVSDSEKEIHAALCYLAQQSRFVIVTGGLGAGSTDMTARAAARAFKQPLVIHEQALAGIRDWFDQRGLSFDPANERQALLPRDAELIPNPSGITPGFRLQQKDCRLFFLPAIAGEMQRMFAHSVLPGLQNEYPDAQRILQRTLKVFGLPETRLRQMALHSRLPEGVKLTLSQDFPLTLIRLRASGDRAQQKLDVAEAAAMQALGDNIMAGDSQTVEGNVARLLTQAGLTLSLAESCTGGLLSHMLTRHPGASAFFDRAGVTYSNAAKQHWLKVPFALLEQHGAVSEACARAMALGLRQQSGTDLALAITGVAGPDGGTADKPVGTVYLALASAAGVHAKRYHFPGDRQRVQRMTAFMALEWLRRFVLQESREEQ